LHATGHLAEFIHKMESENLPRIVIDTFVHYYSQVVQGSAGLIHHHEIEPVPAADVRRWEDLDSFTAAGMRALAKSVRIVLNGGLGTSMGLSGPKSLLPVKDGRSFLDLIISQMAAQDVSLALMNSFSTHEETLAALSRIQTKRPVLCFLQHKFPKILRDTLGPATWPSDPDLEWNPPGHGDIYAALSTSGILDRFLANGIEYAFISNSDNLGASLDCRLLGFFVENGFPFMMEVSQRTVSDIKGGHLARYRSGGLLLRESAQCPENEMDAFQNIEMFRFFNTNNLWVHLVQVRDMLRREGGVRLPMILNPKTLDPRDPKSPKVYQVEAAMGSAISLFPKAAAVQVARSRFFPVKKCADLLVIRSDYCMLSESGEMQFNPKRRSRQLHIRLDPKFYDKLDQFDQRFGAGVPSMVGCASLVIEGDVRFEKDVRLEGDVRIINQSGKQAVVTAGAVISGNVAF